MEILHRLMYSGLVRDLIQNRFVETETECGYFHDDAHKNIAVNRMLPIEGLPAKIHGEMIRQGVRHSGNIYYLPQCRGCSACISMRIPVNQFKPKKHQRRIWNRNRDIEWEVGPLELTEEKCILYKRYIQTRHAGSMQRGGAHELKRFLYHRSESAGEMRFKLGGQLIAVTIIDYLPGDYFSSVYHYFDPDYSDRSLGTYSILAEIELCKKLNIPYDYLGYWVPGCPKMQYKAMFEPFEVLRDGKWVASGGL